MRCLVKNRHMAGKSHAGLSYDVVGCEVKVHKSAITLNKVSSNRNTQKTKLCFVVDKHVT